jgi:uncharacterized protein YkwD
MLVLLPAAQARAATHCSDEALVPSAGNLSRVTEATLCLLNEERAARERPALRASKALANASRSYARTMVRDGFFGHVSPSGSTPLDRIKATAYLNGFRIFTYGENLAWGTGDYATPAHIVSSWMDSPGHRRNILNARFKEIGIGIALGAPAEDAQDEGATYATSFGRRIGR